MPKFIKKCFILLSFAVLLSCMAITANAAENEFSAIISPKNDYYVLQAFVKSPSDLANVDFTVFADGKEVTISDFITENSDSDKLWFDTENIPESFDEETEYFTFHSEKNTNKFSFSGYFVNFYTSDSDFYLGEIKLLCAEEISEQTTVTVAYTLTCEHGSSSGTQTYFIKSGNNTNITEKNTYLRGDADLNGKVTATDARTILRAAVGLEELDFSAYPYANGDCDDKISANDARYALRASVGLEELVYCSYKISLGEGASCENGGTYIFTCELTHTEFSMSLPKGKHIKENTGCFDTGKCTVCNETVFPESPHSYNEKGICSFCGAIEAVIDEAKNALIPILEDIASMDALAYEALKNNKYEDYLKHTVDATARIKEAIKTTKGINGMQNVTEHIEKAYSIRFTSIMNCTENSGKIRINQENCEAIQEAVKESNKHLDYAAYLKD